VAFIVLTLTPYQISMALQENVLYRTFSEWDENCRKCDKMLFTPLSAKAFTKLTISQKALCGDFFTELHAHQE